MNENNTVLKEKEAVTPCDSPSFEYPSVRGRKKPDSANPIIAAISIFMVVFAVILALTVTLINSGDASSSSPDNNQNGVTNGTPIVNPPSEDKIESNRDKPTLPSHVNVSEDKSAYKPVSSADAETIIEITSDAALLVDLASGSVVAQKSPDTVLPIASMTKVMTLIVACDYITSSDMLYATVDVEYSEERLKGYNKAFVSDSVAKETVYVVDMLYGLILFSGADCAYGLAEGFAGSEAAFVQKMNEKAKAIGMNDTTFTNCVGKDDGGNNVSTVRDTATMFAYALKNPLCRDILTSSKWECVGKYTRPSSLWYAGAIPSTVHDNMKSYSSGDLKCGSVNVLGGKSGHETLAGYCLVSVAKNADGKEYVCVTAGNETNSYQDTVYVYKNYAE